MTNSRPSFFILYPMIGGGIFVGILVLTALRVVYYQTMQYTPEMTPQIAFYFLPIIFIVVLLLSVPLEWLFRLWLVPNNAYQAFFVGLAYSTAAVWWAFPGHWQIFIILNPLTTRVAICLISKKG